MFLDVELAHLLGVYFDALLIVLLVDVCLYLEARAGWGVQNVSKVPLRNFNKFNNISFENPDFSL